MVLTRPEQLSSTGLVEQDVHALLDAVVAIPIRQYYWWRPQLDDANDEMLLETAVNGGADRLVTFNLRHLETAANSFGIRALTPPLAWREIEDQHAQK